MPTQFSKFNEQINKQQQQQQPARKRTRGDIMSIATGHTYHIDYYNFDSGRYGDYAYFYLTEDNDHTYYGGRQITNTLKQIEAEGLRDALKSQPVRFERHTFTDDAGDFVQYVTLVFIDEEA